jgi:hypothetical protein
MVVVNLVRIIMVTSFCGSGARGDTVAPCNVSSTSAATALFSSLVRVVTRTLLEALLGVTFTTLVSGLKRVVFVR